MPLSVGDKLGPYEILSPLGEGGMGQVWKARDTRLDRTVALKVAKADFSERFELEARTVAALNHPNICTLHDVGPNYLVMELVEGTTLKGPLPVATAMEYAGQILDALDAVHRKGITHRDLKPANILVTKSGAVKLLDFGLAKIEKGVAVDQATASMSITVKGQILGTMLYMSPEQLQGQDADSRSDIFSFGLVLYEMLTGTHAMQGATPATVIAAILERPAPSVAGFAPVPLDRVLKRCLAKDPDERFQTVRDLKFAVDSISGPSSERSIERPATPRSRWLSLGAGAFFLAAAVFAATRFSAPSPTPFQRLKIVLETPLDERLLLTLSPDGTRFAFGAFAGLRVRALDSLDSQLIPGTPYSGAPTWSPDGRFLAYFTGGELKKVNVAGGTPQTLAGGLPNFRGMAWNNDGTILFSTGTPPMLRVSEDGGTPTPVAVGENGIQPTPLPDGRHFLYLAPSGDKTAIYAGSLDSTEMHQVTLANSQAEFVPPNRLLFLRGTTLMAQPFDLARLRTTGPAVPVAEDIGIVTVSSHASFSSARNGMVTYQTGGVGRNTLTWVDRAGNPTGVVDEVHNYLDLALSPDGKQIATARVDPATLTPGIWVTDLGRGIATRITSEGVSAKHPAWSPDGKRIAYAANGIRARNADGTGTEELLAEKGDMPQWSPDSRTMLFAAGRSEGLSLVSSTGDRQAVPYIGGKATQPAFSPDARWLAYTSRQDGQWEVFVESLPPGHGKWQISQRGGAQPVWSGDGTELYYRSNDEKIMAVPVRTGNTFQAGPSKELFSQMTFGGNSFRRMYAVSSNGQRFLVHRRSQYHPPMVLLQNWLLPGR